MSLDANPLAGHEMGDSAALAADGEWYRCFVWRNKAQGRIDAYCEVVQPSGRTSMAFQSIIDTNPVGGFVESPKIIAVGTTFVVHYISTVPTGESDVDNLLHRATMDMTAFSTAVDGWTDRGTAALHDHALYDACPIYMDTLHGTHATDFVVARKAAADGLSITVQRFDGFDWIDTVWTATPARTIYQAVLGVYANDVDNDVVVSYMRSLGGDPDDDGLWTAHLDADDGGSFTDTETFPEFGAAAWLQVTHEYVGPNVVAVIAEAVLNTLKNVFGAVRPGYAALHDIVYRSVNSTSSANVSNAHWAANLCLCSRAFSYVNGASGQSLYVLASYKSTNDPGDSPRVPPAEADQEDPGTAPPGGTSASDWDQAYFFGLNLDYEHWDLVDTGADLRPRPVQTIYTVGIPDARPSRLTLGASTVPTVAWQAGFRVGKRMNHLAHAAPPPPAGNDVKTRSIAVGVFANLRVQAFVEEPAAPEFTELAPENAGISEVLIYLEDTWTMFRNGEGDGLQPVENFKGINSRAMCVPIEVGRSTFLAGGTPYVYDGRQVVESGYPWRPEMVVSSVSNGTGGLTSSATYYVYFVWSWRDNAGQVHRSGPSPIYSFTTGASDDTVEYVIRSLTISLKDALAHYPLAPAIQCEVFRTAWDAAAGAPGAIFYRVYGSSAGDLASDFGPPQTPVNDPTVHTFNIPDGVADVALVFQGLGPYQYSTDANGNITGFPNILVQTPPAMHAAVSWLGRIFAADSCDEGVVLYSDEILPDYGSDYYAAPTFNDSQTYRMGEVGDIVAMQPMNNALLVYTTKGEYALTAQDPGGGLLQLTMDVLQEGTICIEPSSLVNPPMGVLYQSAKGYYLSNRGREADYESGGRAVEDDIREAGNIRGACQLGDRHEVRLGCNGTAVRTWTTTFTLEGDEPAGEWSISITGSGFTAAFEAGGGVFADVADELEDDFDTELVDETPATTLIDYVQSATSPSNTVVVRWQPGVVPAYTTQAPTGCTLIGVDTEEVAVAPRVEVYNYLYRRWTRADLPQTNFDTLGAPTAPRMSEVVDSLAWQGLARGGTAHVVLTQGNLLIERAEDDPLEFADLTNAEILIDLLIAWQHFAGIAGFQRVWRVGVQGRKLNASQFSCDLDWVINGDYDNPDESDTGVTVAVTSPSYLLIHPRVQKCSAIRVRIYEEAGVSNLENLSITALVFEVGVKKGGRKVPDGQVAA